MGYYGPEKIIDMKKRYLCPPNCVQFYNEPPQFVRGEMQYLYDAEGRQYLDLFAGVSVMNCGHSNPAVTEAAIEQLKTLQHTSIIYLTQPIVELAEALSHVLPGALDRSFFTCTGSEANETAMQMAKLYTGKSDFIALEGGLHGRTYQTMSATGIPMWRSDPHLMSSIHLAKAYTSASCDPETAGEASLASIEALIKTVGADRIAGLIVEPIQGNGGIQVPPATYFKKLSELLKAHDILLIVDEVQTGFARTGKWFAIEHFDVVPDILTVAKALGNGLPISAACTTERIAAQFNRPSASTLGANPVCAKMALAVLKYVETQDLNQRAAVLGNRLKTGLEALMTRYPSWIADVRGIGLMLGAELKDAAVTDAALEFALDAGIIIGKNGLDRNVLAFQPPLVLDETDIDRTLDVLDGFFKKLST